MIALPHTARRMGRPPLKLDDETIKTTLRFPRTLLSRVAALVGENGVAAFVRRAVEEKLARDEKR